MEINSSSNVNAMAYQLMESNIRLSQQASQQAQTSFSGQNSENSGSSVAPVQQTSSQASYSRNDTYA